MLDAQLRQAQRGFGDLTLDTERDHAARADRLAQLAGGGDTQP
jgi:hypothetical protein